MRTPNLVTEKKGCMGGVCEDSNCFTCKSCFFGTAILVIGAGKHFNIRGFLLEIVLPTSCRSGSYLQLKLVDETLTILTYNTSIKESALNQSTYCLHKVITLKCIQFRQCKIKDYIECSRIMIYIKIYLQGLKRLWLDNYMVWVLIKCFQLISRMLCF